MKTSVPVRKAKTAFVFAVLSSALLASFGHGQQQTMGGIPGIAEVDGYTIRIVRLGGDSYGYEIRRGPEVLVRQKRNPFTGSETGLKTREDALKTATWLVKTATKPERVLPRTRKFREWNVMARPIPRAVATELGIAID